MRTNKSISDMEQIGRLKVYTWEEIKDERLGPVGTPERDEHERNVAEALHAYRMGEAVRKARLEQKLTQEQLGERIGVKKAQISKLERGCNLTLSTLSRVFKALGVESGSLDLGEYGKVALW